MKEREVRIRGEQEKRKHTTAKKSVRLGLFTGMTTVLQINQLTKHFGRIKAVQELDLNIEKGQVFGILGPNGSGKTTTLGMLLGVDKTHFRHIQLV